MHSEHYQKYEELTNLIGAEKLIPFLRYGKETIRRAMKEGDEHLNGGIFNLATWGGPDYQVRQLLRESMKGQRFTWSLSQTVCLMKHVARYHFAKEGE